MPQTSLDSFAPEFREGMAARAAVLGDVGESSPEHWEPPLGSSDVHVAIAALSPGRCSARGGRGEGAAGPHRAARGRRWSGVRTATSSSTGRTSFGFKDGIGQPAVEGSGRPSTNPRERPLKAGEIILGYPDETGELPPMPTPGGPRAATAPTSSSASCTPRWRPTAATCATGPPTALRRPSSARRWSGAGRAGLRSPSHRDRDDPELGADPRRNNDFGFADDPRGFKCPVGAHARRANPRDALDEDGGVDVRLHRMIRRGTSYGPVLPDGVLEDDGADRGIIFVFAGAHLKRQFEFVKTQWLNDGIFIGAPLEKDPLVGPERRVERLHDPRAPDPTPAAGPAALRRDARRRVLLRARPEGHALAGGAGHMTDRSTDRRVSDVAMQLIRHGPMEGARLRAAPSRRRGDRGAGAPRLPRRRPGRGGHPQPTTCRQRDHHRDGRPA